jgi:hypothetical protein
MGLFPLARIVVVVPILFIPLFFEAPAFVFVGFWFLIQVFQGTVELLLPLSGGGGGGGGVEYLPVPRQKEAIGREA